MAYNLDFLSHSGWKIFLVFFILVIFLNELIENKMGAFALGLFIAVIIGLFIAGGKKREKPVRRKK